MAPTNTHVAGRCPYIISKTNQFCNRTPKDSTTHCGYHNRALRQPTRSIADEFPREARPTSLALPKPQYFHYVTEEELRRSKGRKDKVVAGADSAQQSESKSKTQPPKDGHEAVLQLFHALRAFDTPITYQSSRKGWKLSVRFTHEEHGESWEGGGHAQVDDSQEEDGSGDDLELDGSGDDLNDSAGPDAAASMRGKERHRTPSHKASSSNKSSRSMKTPTPAATGSTEPAAPRTSPVASTQTSSTPAPGSPDSTSPPSPSSSSPSRQLHTESRRRSSELLITRFNQLSPSSEGLAGGRDSK